MNAVGSRAPRKNPVGEGSRADERAPVEPEYFPYIGGPAGIEPADLLRRSATPPVAHAPQWRDDVRRLRRIVSRAIRQGRWRAARDPRLTEQLQHVGRPELKDFETRTGNIRRAYDTAADRIDGHHSMKLT